MSANLAAEAQDAGADESHTWPLQPPLDACGLIRTALARRLGLSGGVIVTAGRRGLTDPQADQWTIGLGLHPLAVWGWDWIDEADSAAGRPPYVRLAALLRDEIDQGAWRPGEQLPGIHALAKRWRVGAKTVVQALDELRADGVLVGGAGTGTRPLVASTLAAALQERERSARTYLRATTMRMKCSALRAAPPGHLVKAIGGVLG